MPTITIQIRLILPEGCPVPRVVMEQSSTAAAGDTPIASAGRGLALKALKAIQFKRPEAVIDRYPPEEILAAIVYAKANAKSPGGVAGYANAVLAKRYAIPKWAYDKARKGEEA